MSKRSTRSWVRIRPGQAVWDQAPWHSWLWTPLIDVFGSRYHCQTGTVRYQQWCESVSAWNQILCLSHIGIEPATCVPDPLVRGTDPDSDPDSSVHQAKIVGILKVTDEKNRIRSRIRIRILKSVVRIRGSGSVPKCHGSGTLPDRELKLSWTTACFEKNSRIC